MYKHPGVYVEHVPSGLLAIEAASTSTAAFIGPVPRGDLDEPVFVSSISLFARSFGALGDAAGGIRDLGGVPDHFGFAVNAFFANGGSKAYIVPVGDGNGVTATALLAVPGVDDQSFRVNASSAGGWANGLRAQLKRRQEDDPAQGHDLVLYRMVGDKLDKEQILESFTDVSFDPTHGRYLPSQVNGPSSLIEIEAEIVELAGAAQAELANGTDHGAPSKAAYETALTRLRDYRDVSIVLLPGVVWNAAGKEIIQLALGHAEAMANRMVLVDTPDPRKGAELVSPKAVRDLGVEESPYGALYYPWVEVANPFYDRDTAANRPKTFALPPGAFAAGIWARIDTSRGVWKAPAGLEATVRSAQGPNIRIGNDYQDNLNEWGINCIRPITGPAVLWGARTLASKAKPEFRYISVRRTQSMIGESLYLALQAVVFEPNDHRLWASLRASANAFMDGLFRSGAFQGEKATDAYFVLCGLGSTMTQGDIDAGIVRLKVGFAPLKPAEFVVVQIQQIVGQPS